MKQVKGVHYSAGQRKGCSWLTETFLPLLDKEQLVYPVGFSLGIGSSLFSFIAMLPLLCEGIYSKLEGVMAKILALPTN